MVAIGLGFTKMHFKKIGDPKIFGLKNSLNAILADLGRIIVLKFHTEKLFSVTLVLFRENFMNFRMENYLT